MKSKAVRSVLTSLAASICCVITAAAFPYYSGASLPAQTRSSQTSSAGSTDTSDATATFSVSGMTCGSCAVQIQSTLANARGVKSADVSYEKGRAVVRYDPNVTSFKAIRGAIEAIGYKAEESKSESKEAETQPATATANTLGELPASKLKEEFNRAHDKVRVVAILSPTCDACQRGRGVIAEMFDKQKSEKLAGFVVWLPMKPKDNDKMAWLESEKLKDERISVRGWDRNREIGKLFTRPLKLSSTAWDVYLVYAAGVKWEGDQPPQPSYWMHQLQGQRADTMLCLNPTALSSKVQKYLEAGK